METQAKRGGKRQQWQGTKTPSGDRMEKKTLGEHRLSVCGYRDIAGT